MASQWCLLGLLIFNTITDLKCRKILVMPCVFLTLAGIVSTLIRGGFGRSALLVLLSGLFPGLALLCASQVWKGAVGAGDALTLFAAGALLGLSFTVDLLLTGLLLAACFCLIMLALRKAGTKTQIPFMPFLLAGQIVLMLV